MPDQDHHLLWLLVLFPRRGLPSRIRPSVLRMRIIGGKRTLENNLLGFFTLVDPLAIGIDL